MTAPPKTSAQKLAERSRSKLAELGASIPEDHFVCPLCLRLLRDSEASQAHYPAEKLPGPHRSELLCGECNSFIGRAYEHEAIDYLTRTHKVSVGPADGGRIVGRAHVHMDSGTLEIDMVSSPKSTAGPLSRTLNEMRRRSAIPYALQFHLSLPAEEYARRAMLAWSFLEWFFYAGYRYAASAGAELVRRLLLDPDSPLPTGSYFEHGSVSLPLPLPRPIVIIRTEKLESVRDIQETIALGVEWGPSVGVLPFANDGNGRGWRRIAELLAEDELRTIHRWPIREMLSEPMIDKGLRTGMAITQDGERHVIADGIPAEELAELCEGRSRRQLAPPAHFRRTGRLPPSMEKGFTVVGSPEFGGPPVGWRWVDCRLDLFDEFRLFTLLRRGHEPYE